MPQINGVEIFDIKTHNDKMWFSYIKKMIEDLNFGNIEIKLTVKGGQVMNIKTHKESSFSIHNGA